MYKELKARLRIMDCHTGKSVWGKSVEAIEQLERQLAELEAENAKLHEQVDLQIPKMTFTQLKEQLAASQLEAKRLREALTAMVAYAREDSCGLKIADEALSSPTSTEALDAYVAEKVKEAMK